MLHVGERVEASHLGIRDAPRELVEGRGQPLVPRERRLTDHRRGFVRREIVAGAPPPPQGGGPFLGPRPGSRGPAHPSPPPRPGPVTPIPLRLGRRWPPAR